MVNQLIIFQILITLLFVSCNKSDLKFTEISSGQRSNEIICMEDSLGVPFSFDVLERCIISYQNFPDKEDKNLNHILSSLADNDRIEIRTIDAMLTKDCFKNLQYLNDSIINKLLEFDIISEWRNDSFSENYDDHILNMKYNYNFYFIGQIKYGELYNTFLIYMERNDRSFVNKRILLLNIQGDKIKSISEPSYLLGGHGYTRVSSRTNGKYFLIEREPLGSDVIGPAMDVYGTEEYPEGYIPQAVFCYRYTFDDNVFLQFVD